MAKQSKPQLNGGQLTQHARLTGCRSALSRVALTRTALFLSTALLITILGSASDAYAQNLIKRPGAHNHYKFEVEPQFAVSWAGSAHHYHGDYYGSGFGPGVRFSIPFMHNGPITTLNNNIGITFGINTFFYSDRNGYNPVTFTLPVAFQWNFYFTDIISVLGEVGFSTSWAVTRDFVDFYVDPVFQGGGRFQFGKVGVLVRVGYPMISVGANFQF